MNGLEMTLKNSENFQIGLLIYLMMPYWFECLSMPTKSLRANFIMVFLQLLQSNCQSQPTNIGLRDRVRSFFCSLGSSRDVWKGLRLAVDDQVVALIREP